MEERLKMIISILEDRSSLSFSRLAQLCYVSEPTIRRDAAKLEHMGLVEHIYGGLQLAKYKNAVVPIDLRDGANSAAKEQAAQSAAQKIHDGDTVFFDSSSTVRRICHYLQGKKDLTVITNNLRVLQDLKNTDFNVLCTGGTYFHRRDCFLGAIAERFLADVNADCMFFSAQGISEDGVITDVSEEEISMRRAMLQHSKRKYFVCDHSKFGIIKSLRLCTLEDIDGVICSQPLVFIP